MKTRCDWCGDDPLYIEYHDKEWGVPVYDDIKLFEFLTLEGAQAGLSWITILKRREHYQRCFANFDPQIISQFSSQYLEELLQDPGIIRNRLKVYSVRKNAQAFLHIQQEYGSFSDYIWQFVDGGIIQNHWKSQQQIPAQTEISEAMSKDLKKRGFTFVGATICYAFMQAVGLVNDHITGCFRHQELLK